MHVGNLSEMAIDAGGGVIARLGLLVARGFVEAGETPTVYVPAGSDRRFEARLLEFLPGDSLESQMFTAVGRGHFAAPDTISASRAVGRSRRCPDRISVIEYQRAR